MIPSQRTHIVEGLSDSAGWYIGALRFWTPDFRVVVVAVSESIPTRLGWPQRRPELFAVGTLLSRRLPDILREDESSSPNDTSHLEPFLERESKTPCGCGRERSGGGALCAACVASSPFSSPRVPAAPGRGHRAPTQCDGGDDVDDRRRVVRRLLRERAQRFGTAQNAGVIPEARCAKSLDGVHIAYQVIGDADLDLVLSPGFVSHVEHSWEDPSLARFLRRLVSFTRLIVFDKRGTGLSDRAPTVGLGCSRTGSMTSPP